MTNSKVFNYKKPLDKGASICYRSSQSEERISTTVFDIYNNAVNITYSHNTTPSTCMKGVIEHPDKRVINLLQDVILTWRFLNKVEFCLWEQKLLNLQKTGYKYFPANEPPPRGWYLINGVWVLDIQNSSASVEISNSSVKINCVNIEDVKTHNYCHMEIEEFMDWYHS